MIDQILASSSSTNNKCRSPLQSLTNTLHISVSSSTTTKKERRMWQCEMCPKAFDRPSLLTRHVRTHTGRFFHHPSCSLIDHCYRFRWKTSWMWCMFQSLFHLLIIEHTSSHSFWWKATCLWNLWQTFHCFIESLLSQTHSQQSNRFTPCLFFWLMFCSLIVG